MSNNPLEKNALRLSSEEDSFSAPRDLYPISLSSTIGITSTIPVEILFAAGRQPVDLNNLFIQSPAPRQLVEMGEEAGMPAHTCAWIKGIYGAIHVYRIREVVGVVEGDCSETKVLLELLQSEGVTVHPFFYPARREREELHAEIQRFAGRFHVEETRAEAWKVRLDAVRAIAREIDERAWREGIVPSDILFLALLACSDFFADPETCRRRLEAMLTQTRAEPQKTSSAYLRLGVVGVPTILSDLWTLLEKKGARVVYHETPLEFSRIDAIGETLVESYLEYSYPYDIFFRLERIQAKIQERRIDGLIHYVQSFCHRQMHDRLLRERLSLPILTLEADRPGRVDERTKVRIDAFLEQLRQG